MRGNLKLKHTAKYFRRKFAKFTHVTNYFHVEIGKNPEIRLTEKQFHDLLLQGLALYTDQNGGEKTNTLLKKVKKAMKPDLTLDVNNAPPS